MVPGPYNFTLKKGDYFSRTLTYKIGGVAVNLTGYTARLVAKRRSSDSTAILNLTTENSGITLGGAAGTIQMDISKIASAAVGYDRLVFDLELTPPNGKTFTLVSGVITIIEDIAP